MGISPSVRAHRPYRRSLRAQLISIARSGENCKGLAKSPAVRIIRRMAAPGKDPVQEVSSFVESLRLDTLWSENGLSGLAGAAGLDLRRGDRWGG